MKPKRYRFLLYFSLCLALLVIAAACTAAADRDRGTVALPAERGSGPLSEAAAAPTVAPAKRISFVDPYDIEPEPLTVADCGRCHTQHFQQIRDDGGRHRIDCRECHEVFHAYNPRRDNYAELMPKCGDCHGLPHGEKQIGCLDCHEQPHAPLQIPFSDLLVGSCAECHSSPASQLKQYPSAHSAQGCQSCHPKNHGRILSCFDCHAPHYEMQPLAECTQCHDAHQPLHTPFPARNFAKTCNACHGDVFVKWTGTPSKHGQVSCTQCHGSHLAVPNCTDCHAQPHSEGMLAKFTGCLDCHMDAHDLPIR